MADSGPAGIVHGSSSEGPLSIHGRSAKARRASSHLRGIVPPAPCRTARFWSVPLVTQEDPFAALGKKPRRWWIAPLIVLVLLGVVAGVVARRHAKPAPAQYISERVTLGDIEESVEATGTIQPLLQVQVGAQVSGRLNRVLVDYNSRVHAGELVAEIDPTPFRAAVDQARAALQSSRASLAHARAAEALARIQFNRNDVLIARHLIAQADLDQTQGALAVAVADIAVAEAEVSRNEANLSTANTNLAYSRIYAPIDGVVIQRSIDPGQTVAASFQAPVLFIIANDLSRMQILANIDEADVGKLAERLAADARVDAFPGEVFHGTVSQIRYGSVTSAGVVTYPAVVDLANPDLKLRPGMTATITVVTQRHSGVLRVPNAALRYRPGAGGNSVHAQSGRAPRGLSETEGHGTLYVVHGGRAVRVPVTVGISDGYLTEVSGGGLRVNDAVVLDDTGVTASGRPQQHRLF